jgi:5-methylcytosine-specific restriction endonuclease McrA
MKMLEPKLKPIDPRRGGNPNTERIRGAKLQKIRERILLRDNYTCAGCGRITAYLQVDHVVPLFMGGSESDENRQLMCDVCHDAKSAREEMERRGDVDAQ